MTTINITRGTANPYYRPESTRKVGDLFRIRNQNFLAVTDAQGASFERVVARQGLENYLEAHYDHLDNYLAVAFSNIFIGIEPDGYAHS